MRIYREISELSAVTGPVSLAIGVFDGLHIGHQAVVQRAMQGASTDGGSAVVVTFDPHPVTVLRPDKAPRLLISTPHKILLFERIGVQHFLAVRFSNEFANTPASQFVEQLADVCGQLRRICVGEDWAFGRNREGNVSLLEELGNEYGFSVEPVAAVRDETGEELTCEVVDDSAKARDVIEDTFLKKKLGEMLGAYK